MLSHSSNAHDRIVPRSETRSWELHPSLPEVSGSQLFRQSLLPPGSVMQNNLVSRSQMWSEARQSNVGVGVPTCVTTSRLNALYNTKFIFLTFISWKVQRWDQDGRTAGKATVQEYFHPKWALVQNQAAPHPIQLPSSGLAKASEDDLVAWGPCTHVERPRKHSCFLDFSCPLLAIHQGMENVSLSGIYHFQNLKKKKKNFKEKLQLKLKADSENELFYLLVHNSNDCNNQDLSYSKADTQNSTWVSHMDGKRPNHLSHHLLPHTGYALVRSWKQMQLKPIHSNRVYTHLKQHLYH